MEKLRHFQNFAWCKPDWCLPSTSKETDELLRQCTTLPLSEPSDDIEELIRKSNEFPIPFPIESVRLSTLKDRRPIDRLKRNIVSTYPLIHERVLLLMTHFLIYKREFGSSIEKAYYKDMTVPEFIDRILTKRAISFVGPHDSYKLITGETGQKESWESVGTLQQKEPLVLQNCLSYDEMKISAMVYVSSYTECINNGERHNSGEVCEKGIEENAVIIGIIGPRFERRERMDYEDILITESQNCPENGYGEEVTPTTCLNVLKTTYVRNNQSAKHMWRQMWAEFYQVPSYTYTELSSYVNTDTKSEEQRYTDRFVSVNWKTGAIFDNEAYYKRICIIAETVLLEAQYRAKDSGRDAFINVIGADQHNRVFPVDFHGVDDLDDPIRADPAHQLLRAPQPTDNRWRPCRLHVDLNLDLTGTPLQRWVTKSHHKHLLFPLSERKIATQHPHKSNFPGLGVWKVASHQNDVYVLTFVERIRSLLKRDALSHVTDVNFAYITVSDSIKALFTNSTEGNSEDAEMRIFLESKKHPKGGINVQFENREPSSALAGGHSGKLLVMTYPWDGNAHPGNEFWFGSLSGSGDPAAACSTQVAELHTARINAAVAASHARVVTAKGINRLSEYTRTDT